MQPRHRVFWSGAPCPVKAQWSLLRRQGTEQGEGHQDEASRTYQFRARDAGSSPTPFSGQSVGHFPRRQQPLHGHGFRRRRGAVQLTAKESSERRVKLF